MHLSANISLAPEQAEQVLDARLTGAEHRSSAPPFAGPVRLPGRSLEVSD